MVEPPCKEVELFDRLRIRAGLPVSGLTVALLKVSRVTYYTWLRGGEVRKENRRKLALASRILVAALKSGRLPVRDLTGAERKAAIAREVRNTMIKLREDGAQ